MQSFGKRSYESEAGTSSSCTLPWRLARTALSCPRQPADCSALSYSTSRNVHSKIPASLLQSSSQVKLKLPTHRMNPSRGLLALHHLWSSCRPVIPTPVAVCQPSLCGLQNSEAAGRVASVVLLTRNNLAYSTLTKGIEFLESSKWAMIPPGTHLPSFLLHQDDITCPRGRY